MPFPTNAETVTVKGQYLGPDGEPARGHILVTLDQSTADRETNTIYTRKPLRYDLDGNGMVEFDIIKTGSTPADPVALSRNVAVTITENFDGVKKYTWKTVFDTNANDETDVFQLADAAEVVQRPLNQYVLLGTYAADLNAKASVSYVDTTFAPKASPTFTGTVSGITKSMVGLGNVDNTSDANKPVSTAQATAIGLKANTASPTFTGTVDLSTANITTDTTTGTKIGTAITQKLGFFNATPVVQPTAGTDLGTTLSNLGLRAAGTNYPISTSGAVSFTGPVRKGVLVTTTTSLTLTSTSVTNQIINSASAVQVNLPTTAVTGLEFVIKNIGAGTVTVGTAGTTSFDGSTAAKTLTTGQMIRIVYSSTNNLWYVVG